MSLFCPSLNAAQGMPAPDSMDVVLDDVDDLMSTDLVVDGTDLNELPDEKLPYQSFRDLLVDSQYLKCKIIDPPVLTALRADRRQVVLFNDWQHLAEPVVPEPFQALVQELHKSVDKQLLKEWRTKQERLRTLLHNIHTQEHGSVLFQHNVKKLSKEIEAENAVLNFCWVFCCKQMMDVERMFHEERLDKWCWIVKFIVDNTTACDNTLSLRILEFFVQAQIECQSEPKTPKQIQRKIAKIDKCLKWVHKNFPQVATGYQDCCAKMLSYACNDHNDHNDQACFYKQANILAHFVLHSDKCHLDVVRIFARAGGSVEAGSKYAAEFCFSWLLQRFPYLGSLTLQISDEIGQNDKD